MKEQSQPDRDQLTEAYRCFLDERIKLRVENEQEKTKHLSCKHIWAMHYGRLSECLGSTYIIKVY